MRLTRVFHLTIVAITVGASVSAGDSDRVDLSQGCKRNPAVVGECFQVHARVVLANGTPGVRIWPVGTKRIFGVVPSENEIMPENLRRHLRFDRRIYGDFLVCPFTLEKPGWMRMVCIDEASNLVIEEFGAPGEKPRLYRDPSIGQVP